MNFLALNYCALSFVIFMDLNLATVDASNIIKWKSRINKITEKHEDDSIAMKPKNLIVFIVDKPFLRSNDIKQIKYKNDNNLLLEPFKSFAVDDEIRMKGSKKISKQRKKNVTDEYSEETLRSLKLTKEQSDMLRKKWNRSCDKKATKVCKKACKQTYKQVCKIFRCPKKQKNMFNKYCLINCKIKFSK